MRKTSKIALSIATLAVLIGASAESCDTSTNDGKTYADTRVSDAKAAPKSDAKSDAKRGHKPAKPAAPQYTEPQKNAVAKAEDYLDYDAFSQKGLIDQLKFDGFSVKLADFAVDHIKVDWNKQALAKAKDYLDYDSFSHQSLVEQLEFDGFTKEQAEHGATGAGL